MQDQSVPEVTARQHIASASGAARLFCQWPLSAVVATKRIRCTRAGSLWLPTLHLREVRAVSDSRGPLLGSEYEWDEDGLVRVLRRRWVARETYTVVFAHGYLDHSEEIKAIRGIVLSAAARLVENPTSQRAWATGSESASYAGGNSDLTAILTGGEKADLLPFQLPVLG